MQRPLPPTISESPSQRTQRILTERAKTLARPNRPPSVEEAFTILTFVLGTQRFALALEFVRETRLQEEYAHVPHAPPGLLGVHNLRGEMIPVLDLRRILALSESSPIQHLIILEGDHERICFPAEAIGRVKTVPRQTFRPPLATLRGQLREFSDGQSTDGLTLLRGQRILRHDFNGPVPATTTN